MAIMKDMVDQNVEVFVQEILLKTVVGRGLTLCINLEVSYHNILFRIHIVSWLVRV